MCNASKKCRNVRNVTSDKTNYAVYLGFYESEGLAGLMLLMFIYLFTDTICVILWKPVRCQLRLIVT